MSFKNGAAGNAPIFGIIVCLFGVVEAGADDNGTAQARLVALSCRKFRKTAESQVHASRAAPQFEAAQTAAKARLQLRRPEQAKESGARVCTGENRASADLFARF